MRAPVLVDGALQTALTHFRVRRSSPHGLAWVELTPQTGQLRAGCGRCVRGVRCVALHAHALACHRRAGQRVAVACRPPAPAAQALRAGAGCAYSR